MYDAIAANRRNTFLLIAIIIGVLMLVGYALGLYWGLGEGGLLLAGIVALMWVGISYFNGASILLSASRAREIQKADNPKLFNVVEELTIASGLPMPKIYIIEDSSPNAFATGRDPEHAAVAITTGLLEKLDRAELQGVMAHELAHIQNRDILYATLIGALAGAIILISEVFLRSLHFGAGRSGRSGRNRGGAGLAPIIVLGAILAVLAPIIAQLLQLAVSRQREYLADASAALMTRYPEGLASALEKIARDPDKLEVASRATQHLYIVNPFEKDRWNLDSLWSTHPPLEERIKRLRALR
ncbi:MAG: M48 family metallopeptidase [Candidatus Bipolaricaulota bacterium]|nr:M48 family metallopeptidase [Candidatus Bipolaricaulota bacterium]MDW8141099.1 M48 family metallopeptidase [Candidatus Bipolaricaulota bacterium]